MTGDLEPWIPRPISPTRHTGPETGLLGVMLCLAGLDAGSMGNSLTELSRWLILW
jgi:hypothetical protein